MITRLLPLTNYISGAENETQRALLGRTNGNEILKCAHRRPRPCWRWLQLQPIVRFPSVVLSSIMIVITIIMITIIMIMIVTQDKINFISWRFYISWASAAASYFMQSIYHATYIYAMALQWRHNVRDGVFDHQPHDCLLSRLFRRRSKKTSKLCVTGLCAGNSPVTGEFPTQRASNADNIPIWWRHHVITAGRSNEVDDCLVF